MTPKPGLFDWAVEEPPKVITIAQYVGQCACQDPGDCATCPEKEYDQGGEA